MGILYKTGLYDLHAHFPTPLLQMTQRAGLTPDTETAAHSQRRQIAGGISLDSVCVALRISGEVLDLSPF